MKMQMKTNVARFARLVVISGTAALAATILVPNAHATMLTGAVGNDGFGGFDGSILAKSRSEYPAARATEQAINGSGLSANGLHTVSNANNLWMGDQESNWYIVDLGASYLLQQVDFWNFQNGSNQRGVASANIYYSNGATEPNASNPDLNPAAFNSTGWTLFQSGYSFTALTPDPTLTPFGPSDIINFGPGGLQTRFFALGNITILDTVDGFVGISEMQFITAVPEPSIVALVALGGLLVRVRRSLR